MYNHSAAMFAIINATSANLRSLAGQMADVMSGLNATDIDEATEDKLTYEHDAILAMQNVLYPLLLKSCARLAPEVFSEDFDGIASAFSQEWFDALSTEDAQRTGEALFEALERVRDAHPDQFEEKAEWMIRYFLGIKVLRCPPHLVRPEMRERP